MASCVKISTWCKMVLWSASCLCVNHSLSQWCVCVCLCVWQEGVWVWRWLWQSGLGGDRGNPPSVGGFPRMHLASRHTPTGRGIYTQGSQLGKWRSRDLNWTWIYQHLCVIVEITVERTAHFTKHTAYFTRLPKTGLRCYCCYFLLYWGIGAGQSCCVY